MYVFPAQVSQIETQLTARTGGGMPTSTNRTKWPIGGGAISLQPGWFPGHSLALFYINMGFGNEPLNYSHSMLPVFQITGPSNVQYNGSFCLPQVPLPANYTPKVGDNATIQVIETAQHGAALYNVSFCQDRDRLRCPLLLTFVEQCADITFAEPADVPEVNSTNCRNSTHPDENIGFQLVYTTTSSLGYPAVQVNGYVSLLVPVMLVAASWLTWI